VGTLSLQDGRAANVVLIGPRENPRGATLVLPGEGGGPVRAVPLAQGLGLLHPQTVIDIICMQERLYGKSNLTPPVELGESS
jgi:hypothetical protein